MTTKASARQVAKNIAYNLLTFRESPPVAESILAVASEATRLVNQQAPWYTVDEVSLAAEIQAEIAAAEKV